MIDEMPLYESSRSAANLWQSYRVFTDRIQLRTMFGTFNIAYSEIVRLERCGPLLTTFRIGDLAKAKNYRMMKLDWADFREHLQVERQSGLIRGFCFTPDEMDHFLEVARSAAARSGVRKFER